MLRAMRKQKTVLITAMPVAGRPVSGVAHYTAELVRDLVASGEDIEVWANVDARGDEVLGERLIRRWHYGSAWRELLVPLIVERPSLVHLQHSLFLYGARGVGAFAPLALMAACKLLRIPLVVTLHDLPTLGQITRAYVRTHRYHYDPRMVRAALRVLFGTIIASAQRIIVHHDVFRDALVRDYGCPPDRVHVVPLGVLQTVSADRLISRELFAIAAESFVVGFFGYAAPYKGLEVLLGAAERLAASGDVSTVFLVSAGRQPSRHGDREYAAYYSGLKRRAEALSNVQWAGYVSDDDVAAFYTSCDIAVFPYVAFQGVSGPLSIASSYGLPFLCSSVVSRSAGNVSVVTFEPDPEELAGKLLQFRDSADFRNRVVACCNEFARAQRERDPRELTARLYALART
jgi:glycosyltransferase involved in cell wall biosynthesis